jgi:hypothetical protein
MTKPARPTSKSTKKPAKSKKPIGADDLGKVTGGISSYQSGGHGVAISSATGGAGAGKARKAGGTQ